MLKDAPAAGLSKHPALVAILVPVLAFFMAVASVRHDPVPPFLSGNYSPTDTRSA